MTFNDPLDTKSVLDTGLAAEELAKMIEVYAPAGTMAATRHPLLWA